ncbi:LiaI-LiaF-like domain-containing protein [Bacillus sp. 2205SS5-2]|uniref:LiaI-LiaF-like domain-containing protein n=1 Tax=Bacillus sp. 2205SS5-2 TaxID=3109031 RepID=UPI003006B53A
MKKQRLFPAVILIGFGLFFYLQEAQIELFSGFFNWPTLFLIIGFAFLMQGYKGKDHEAILPGVILSGFGLHFHVLQRLTIWPDHIGVFILIISLGFLLRYQKTGDGLWQGILFLVLSITLLFYQTVMQSLQMLETRFSFIWQLWPLFFIGVGVYLLFFNRK